MITTNNILHDQRFRLLRQHGMSVSDAARHNAADIIFEDYVITGFNGRMTDIQAAVGSEQLKRLPGIIKRRRKIAAVYHERLNGIDGLRLLHEPSHARSNWQSYLVFLDDPSLQRPFMRYLLERGISTRRGIMCAHLEPPYISIWNDKRERLRNSELARDTGVILPLYTSMTDEDIDRVTDEVRGAIKNLQ